MYTDAICKIKAINFVGRPKRDRLILDWRSAHQNLDRNISFLLRPANNMTTWTMDDIIKVHHSSLVRLGSEVGVLLRFVHQISKKEGFLFTL